MPTNTVQFAALLKPENYTGHPENWNAMPRGFSILKRNAKTAPKKYRTEECVLLQLELLDTKAY